MTIEEQATHRAIQSIAKKMREQDWEQRRYEIARDLYVRQFETDLCDYPSIAKAGIAQDCVEAADFLINALKKNNGTTNTI